MNLQEQQEGVFDGEMAFFIADPLELDALLERVEAIRLHRLGEPYSEGKRFPVRADCRTASESSKTGSGADCCWLLHQVL